MVDTRTARSRELAALKVRVWFEERRLTAMFSARSSINFQKCQFMEIRRQTVTASEARRAKATAEGNDADCEGLSDR